MDCYANVFVANLFHVLLLLRPVPTGFQEERMSHSENVVRNPIQPFIDLAPPSFFFFFFLLVEIWLCAKGPFWTAHEVISVPYLAI